MKYSILFLACLFCATATFAQEAPGNPVANTLNDFDATIEATPTPGRINLQSDKKTRGGTRWYDIIDAVDRSQGSQGTIYGNDHYNQMWSDSTILAPFSGSGGVNYSDVWIKSVASYLDPVDARYNNPLTYGAAVQVDNATAFSIDSLFIPFVYTRNAAKANIVDTLIVSVVYGNGGGTQQDLDIRFYGPTSTTSANHNTDTLRVLHGFMDLNPQSANRFGYLASSTTNVHTVKVPLTVASLNDTVKTGQGRGFNFVKIPVGLQVPAGNKVAASIVYKSGDTWIPNVDTIYTSGSFSTPNFNNFRFIAFEEINGGHQQYVKGTWTQSSYMRNDTSGWQNRHIPSYAFDNTSYEHQWFQWLVNCPTCGAVDVNDFATSVKGISIYPNPSSDFTTVKFETTATTQDAKIEVMSISGKVIRVIDLGDLAASRAINERINTSTLAKGMYFVKLSSANGSVVEKILVD